MRISKLCTSVVLNNIRSYNTKYTNFRHSPFNLMIILKLSDTVVRFTILKYVFLIRIALTAYMTLHHGVLQGRNKN